MRASKLTCKPNLRFNFGSFLVSYPEKRANYQYSPKLLDRAKREEGGQVTAPDDSPSASSGNGWDKAAEIATEIAPPPLPISRAIGYLAPPALPISQVIDYFKKGK